jgi:acetyl esterase/lipase
MAHRLSHFCSIAVTLALVSAIACAARETPPGDSATDSVSLMTPQDLQAIPSRPPDQRLTYGEDSRQYGELRVPGGSGPHPVAVLIHGGCFMAAYANARDLAPMADALKDRGIASWNIEYRRVGHPGGGWPSTYRDVGRAVDQLRTLAGPNALDLDRVVIVGHSAGGHLAMWAAARARVPKESPIFMAAPLPVRGVVNLAGPVDLTANIPGYEGLCRDSVVTMLLGGTPATVPDRYAQASPIKLLPLGIPQVIVIGEHEDFVPRPLVEAYALAAAAAGDSLRLVVIPRVGHFEIASPRASTWSQVESAIRSLLDGKLPPPVTK